MATRIKLVIAVIITAIGLSACNGHSNGGYVVVHHHVHRVVHVVHKHKHRHLHRFYHRH